MKAWKRVGLTLLLVVVWAGLVLAGAMLGWWKKPLTGSTDPQAFLQAALPLIKSGNRANTAVVLVDNGVVAAKYYSDTADRIDRDTVFAAASLSKWIAAHAVMKLVEQGKLDLDRPVESYLTRWKFPPSAFDSRGVTVRRLLSHTAGLTDGLGFGDYRRDEPLPTLEQQLAAPRASSARPPGPVTIGIEPGTAFKYSGGGYLMLELLVEEVSGEPFETFVAREILQPLDMSRSGYADLATVSNSAKSYDRNGKPAEIVRYAAKAATAFTTSAGDLTKLVLADLHPSGSPVLNATTLSAMRAPQAQSMGVDIWGLGTILYAPTREGDVVYGHDGVNDPAMNATVRINPSTGDAIIVLATGSADLATRLGAEWVFWQTGLPDVLTVPAAVRGVMPTILAGALAIVLVAVLLAWRSRRRPAQGADAISSATKFPPDIAGWLSASLTAAYAQHLASSSNDTRKTLASLGVAKDSELAHLYLQYGPSAVKGWYELVEADDIADCTEYAREELGVPKGFLALSSAEGEGVVLFEKATGAVYDVQFGEFEQLASGALKPVAPTVVEFLHWCKAKDHGA